MANLKWNKRIILIRWRIKRKIGKKNYLKIRKNWITTGRIDVTRSIVQLDSASDSIIIE